MTEANDITDHRGFLQITREQEGSLRLLLRGRLDSNSTADLWREAMEALEQVQPAQLVIDATDVEYCDGAGAGLLIGLGFHQKQANGTFEIQGLRDEFRQLLTLFDPGPQPATTLKRPSTRSLVEGVGKTVANVWSDMRTLIAFVGELTAALFYVLVHPRKMRWKDAFLVAEAAGANALGIIVVIGFLIGLILAFQSAIPLKRYGAEIFVADIVAVSVLRELGPLMTAIILAGRSGSAFAAELGTMKVNEELDALTTMGLDPVRWLAPTRIIAVVVVTPLLTMFNNLFGLIGCGVFLLSIGYPVSTCLDRFHSAIQLSDLLGGLSKAAVFGLLIAAIGCLRGLQTGLGAREVGISTTRAVVSGIFLIILADGVFGVLFYFLDI